MAKLWDNIKAQIRYLAALDPVDGQKIEEWGKLLAGQLYARRDKFDLRQVLAETGIREPWERRAIEAAYGLLIERVWKDQKVTAGERSALDWSARMLNLRPDDAARLELQTGLQVFGKCLADAMDGGEIAPEDKIRLSIIAGDLNASVPLLMGQFFASQGGAFLRGMFVNFAENHQFNDAALGKVLDAVGFLGLGKNAFLSAIRLQAMQTAEEYLASAKADENLSPEEEKTILWMLDNFGFDAEHRKYFEDEIVDMKSLMAVRDGKLPTISARDVELDSGELAHYQGPASYIDAKRKKTGEGNAKRGRLTITDSRIIFASVDGSHQLKHSKVLEIQSDHSNAFKVMASGRGGGIYVLDRVPRMAAAIYTFAVRRVKRTAHEKYEGLPSRHISRDVRQRVFQRYGGRCAECGASQYLEHDHIIPVEKGGSNSDQNVQLLCRKCNLKKRNLI
ncbi:MAG: HNH endonuclease [Planctomycetes bacterium]|nr:HNH endonuclease [Planctomycetota bacterium]